MADQQQPKPSERAAAATSHPPQTAQGQATQGQKSSQVVGGDKTDPTPAPTPDKGGKKCELKFNNKTCVKLMVPDGVNIHQQWNQFQNDHAHVTDRVNSFPTSFAGHLVDRCGCVQLKADEKCDETMNFRIT